MTTAMSSRTEPEWWEGLHTAVVAGATGWCSLLSWRGFGIEPSRYLGPLVVAALLIALTGWGVRRWTTQEWLHFLQTLPPDLGAQKMADLDAAFNLTKVGNAEIAFQWLMMSIKNKYAPADARIEEFLTSIGRRKFVKPLFEELVKTPEGRKRAEEIYAKARPGYHPITQTTVDGILKPKS